MNARLVAMSGPLKGTTVTLDDSQLSIGRESANRIPISDLSTSRRHCLITKKADRFWIVDLDSRNGTFVNGLPVKERLLEHGDQIKIGDSIFLFLFDKTEAINAPHPVEFAQEDVVTVMALKLRREDAIYLSSEMLLASLPPDARAARDLNALLKISTAISSARNLDEFQRQLLELIAEVAPIEHGAMLLAEEGAEDFTSVFGWSSREGRDELKISYSIARQVFCEGDAILSSDLQLRGDLKDVESLDLGRSRSLMVVPITFQEKTFGVIYLESGNQSSPFDQDHLQLVTAIASIAAPAIENIRRVEWLERENQRLSDEINLSHNMIGEGPRMREVYQLIARVAPTDSTVLIRGESGTGKELAARAIHQNSSRADKPFVAINCAALTETLLESELFGHEKGAFTGAVAQKKGRIEIAQGGALFLDEIGEMALLLQAKLLRVLQEHEFERVGGVKTIKADVRIIAATNRELEEEIKKSGFRQDLYYRLNVVSLTMPPLRERREDIPMLANYFVAKYRDKCKRQLHGISAEARARLINYDWPGNVRELENAVERAVVMGASDLIQPEDLPESLLEAESPGGAADAHYHEAIKQMKRKLILDAFKQAGGSYTEAAKLLGVHPNYLHRLIRNLNLKAELR